MSDERELHDDELEGIAGGTDPVPYPDIGGGGSSTGTKKVKISGKKAESSSSSGDDAGSSKGLVSTGNTSQSSSTLGAPKVKFEGKGIVRL